jgi:hypothetical protein
MSKEKKAIKKPDAVSQNILKTVTDQLNSSLTSLKEHLGEKKFEKRIKKAVKILVSGIKKTAAKKTANTVVKANPVKKKAAKHASKKKTAKQAPKKKT